MDGKKEPPHPILIDANIFLEVLLEREHVKECRPLLGLVQSGFVPAYVTSFVLHSIEVHLDHARKPKTLERFLTWVSEAKGLTVYPTSPQEEAQAASLCQKIPLDFDDSLQYHVATSLNLLLITFDTDFDDVNIKTQQPSSYLLRHF